MEEIGFWEGTDGSYFMLTHDKSDGSVTLMKVYYDGSISIIPINLFLYSKLKYHSELILE